MSRHIYEINHAWGNMLQFYCDLNNARKESDEKWLEAQGIQEDSYEPDDGKKLVYSAPEVVKKQDWDEGSEQDTREMLSELKQELL